LTSALLDEGSGSLNTDGRLVGTNHPPTTPAKKHLGIRG
jgi:hypothetical protein